MKFDWYQATINASKNDVFSAMEKAYPYADLRPSKPSNGYTFAAELTRGNDVILNGQWGGVNGDATTHVKATGSNSPAFAAFAREHFPSHQVSRLDVAIDYAEEGSFEKLSKAFVAFAKLSNLKTAVAGDWIKHIGGKTLYLGSRTSSTYLRLYEKGKQLGLDANPHWTRCELEVKPSKKEGKEWLASASPLEAWGASKWSINIAALLDKLGISRAPVGTVRTISDDERAAAFLFKQYGPLLRRLYELAGEENDAFAETILRGIYPDRYTTDENGRTVQSVLPFDMEKQKDWLATEKTVQSELTL